MSAVALEIARWVWRGLRRIVEHLGRWTIRTLARRGALALANYMRIRTDVFRARLARVLARKRHAAWRVRFLRGRIRRWLAAARWLEAKADKIGNVTERKLAPYIDDLPEVSPWENPDAWRRMAA